MMQLRYGVSIFVFVLLSIGAMVWRERERHSLVSRTELLAVREKLKALSSQEKKDLTFYIEQALFFDYYSYTLVRQKPMSMSRVIVEATEDLDDWLREAFERPTFQGLMRGYLVWEKYQSLFPRKNLIVMDYSFFGKGDKEVVIICPQLLMAKIEEHLSDFQNVLGRDCTSEEVFEIATHPEHKDFYTIIDRTYLFGILLGFGRENARLYEQVSAGASRTYPRHESHAMLPGFSDELPWPKTQLMPNFACDPTTEETKQLKVHYKQAQRIVYWTYFLRNNLEVALALLMQ